MKLMRFTIELAFQDIQEASVGDIRELLSRAAIDGAEAEVTRIDEEEATITYPDPDFDDDSFLDPCEEWQERAHTELDAWGSQS
jgi:hypothetical protein